ncbi:MAG: hypothetical protein ABI947_10540 [Chloroflexota bacterium]
MLSQTQAHRRTIFSVTLLLLLIAASRILRLSLDQRDLHVDEVWSVWQLLGAHPDYMRDAAWPPLYYIVLDGWRQLVGLHPVVLRFLSALLSLIGAASIYRVARRLWIGNTRREMIGLMAMVVYSALALSTLLTTQVRGYALVYALLPVAFWFTLRYFDHPQIRRAIPLALTLAAMFYTWYGSVGAFLLIGIYTLLVYRQAIWRWWLPGIIAGLIALPGIIGIMGLVTNRIKPLSDSKIEPLIPALTALYKQDAGSSVIVWLLLFGIATVLIAISQWAGSGRPDPYKIPSGVGARPASPADFSLRTERRLGGEDKRFSRPLALLVWIFVPVIMYGLNSYLGLFSANYTWYFVLGLALWMAWGLSQLPRSGQIVALAVLVGVLFTPIPYAAMQITPPPLGRSFAWLAQHVQWGDVIAIDPLWKDRYCNCVEPEVFDYLSRLYFPQGLPVVSNPDGYRRVWYLKWASLEDQAFEQRVRQNRVEGMFVGPPEALFRLYEAPPDSTGIPFENGMRFHGIDIIDQKPGLLARRVRDTVRVRLWWSVDKPITVDYSVALHIYANGQLVTQSDSAPQIVEAGTPHETSRWQMGRFYIEERDLEIPDSLITGAYPINLIVYWSGDQVRISAPGVTQDRMLPIYTLNIKAW